MQIAEVYESIQGEGRLTGTHSLFVRTSGCNLRCSFCDTPFTSWDPQGQTWSWNALRDHVLTFAVPHLVITGGEPLLSSEMIPLCEALQQAGRHITIETAGTLYVDLPCDLMSISPKLSNSTPTTGLDRHWIARHERVRYRPDLVQSLLDQYDYQLKFVVAKPDDLEEVAEYLGQLRDIDPQRVYLMPEGTEHTRLQAIEVWLAPLCTARGWQLCPRRHIEWFGAQRGT